MNYKVVNINNKKYIDIGLAKKLSSEQDVLEIVSICMENDTYILMMQAEEFSEDFYNLRTGLAGIVLQKFINYHIKVAVILDDKENLNHRFKEMIGEANKGNNFRTFNNIEEAQLWILKL